MPTLYISDLDGTLLGADSLVSSRSAEIISELSRQGALITIATARTPATVVPLLHDTLTLPPAIVMTGTAFWHREPGAYSCVKVMPENDRAKTLAICADNNIYPFIYTMGEASILQVYHAGDSLNSQEQSFVDERRNLPLKRFHLHTPAPESRRDLLYYAISRADAVYDAAAKLKEETECSVSAYPDIFNHDMAHLEIFAPGVSKASAITRLKEMTGADRVVVFGDNLNDLPMFEIADVAVAVDNAFDEAKAKADIIIGPNTEDSVAKFIREDFNGQRFFRDMPERM